LEICEYNIYPLALDALHEHYYYSITP
jgi:hypothetical protein